MMKDNLSEVEKTSAKMKENICHIFSDAAYVFVNSACIQWFEYFLSTELHCHKLFLYFIPQSAHTAIPPENYS